MAAPAQVDRDEGFVRGLNLFDSTMIVIGVMIGSGIFIVSADMARTIGSSGWLLAAWAFSGLLTVAAALSYGELASMMPRAGGMYVYLREAYSPLLGFPIRLDSVHGDSDRNNRGGRGGLRPLPGGACGRGISESNYLIAPVQIGSHYALSLSTAQLTGMLVICVSHVDQHARTGIWHALSRMSLPAPRRWPLPP